MDILFGEAIRFDEGLVSVVNVFLIFDERGLIHEDFEGFFAVGRIYDYFIKEVGEGRIFGGNFEKLLVVHNHDDTDSACFEDGNEEVGDIDRARTFFEEEMSVIKAEDDIFG